MTFVQIQVLENEIRDLQRIVDADEAILASEKSPERRLRLSKEIGTLQYEIDPLSERIDALHESIESAVEP